MKEGIVIALGSSSTSCITSNFGGMGGRAKGYTMYSNVTLFSALLRSLCLNSIQVCVLWLHLSVKVIICDQLHPQ